MNFEQTSLNGVFIIHLEPKYDDRGYFARSWCEKEFGSQKLVTQFLQNNIAYNKYQGTLRGMHYQDVLMRQTKIIQCIRGAAYTVAVDIRTNSNSFKQHIVIELASESHTQLYIPTGVALGYQTLQDNTELFYQMSKTYDPKYEHGFRWNDPVFQIKWPDAQRIILERDANYPDFELME